MKRGTLRARLVCLVRGHDDQPIEDALWKHPSGWWVPIDDCGRCGRTAPRQLRASQIISRSLGSDW